MIHEIEISYTTSHVYIGCTCKRYSKKVKKLDFFEAKVSHAAHVDAVNILNRSTQ